MSFTSKHRMVVTTAALFATALIGACSGKNKGVEPIAEADLPLHYAHAICDNIQGCCGRLSYPYDSAACLAAVQTEVARGFTKEKPKNGVYSPVAAGKCIAQIGTVVRACADPAEGDEAIEDACGGIYAGTKSLGEACENSGDCAANTGGRVRCEDFGALSSTPPGWGDGGAAKGPQCTLFKTPAKGDPCGAGAKDPRPTAVGDCQGSKSAFFCDYKTSTCQPRAAIGQACELNGSNHCVAGSSCKDNVCVAVGGLGAACRGFDDCATDLYCDGAFTNSGDGKCAAKKQTGEACSQSGSERCAHGTCSKGKCSAGSFANADVCAGVLEKGSSSGSSPGDGGTVVLGDGG